MRVVMLDIDGLQPAYMGPYGCEWVSTPTLDAWTAAGVVFDQHFADCPDPAADPSWRTGRHPMFGTKNRSDLLADLRSAGIRTAIVGPACVKDGWDIALPTKRDKNPLALKPVRRALRQAIDKLGNAADALLRVEIDALLPPWSPAPDFLAELFPTDEDDESAESPQCPPVIDRRLNTPPPELIADGDDATFDRLQRTYGAAVATLDDSLGKLLADLDKYGWGDDAFWLLTSRRGFPLGEHGAVGFASADLHEELVHLPLLMRWPSAEHAGIRSSAFTQPMDLAPTLRELFGLPVTAGADPFTGTSQTALARGGEMRLRDRAITGLRRGDRTQWAYRSPGWNLLLDDDANRKRRLFVKPDDRWEVNDVLQHNQEWAEEMEREFRLYLAPGQ
jgi:arylsulfatase A-like enzyme